MFVHVMAGWLGSWPIMLFKYLWEKLMKKKNTSRTNTAEKGGGHWCTLYSRLLFEKFVTAYCQTFKKCSKQYTVYTVEYEVNSIPYSI